MRSVMEKTLLGLGAAGVGAAILLVAGAPSPAQEQAEYVGSDLCAECHVDQWDKFEGTVHQDVLSYVAEDDQGLGGCEACHGPGSLHVELAGGMEPGFLDAIDGEPGPEACSNCHTDVVAQFSLTERHPVMEGFMACADCHEPHGSSEPSLLADTVNETCSECHADKAGPWVFPHPVVEAEGCVACHQPHGSVNPHMLPFREVGFVCLSCHTFQPSFHVVTNVFECTSCHYSIHGSNLDPFFLE